MKKSGTNFTDRNAIRAYVEAGETNAAMIAENLNLKVPPVQGYIDNLTPTKEEPDDKILDLGDELPEAVKPRRRKAAAV